MVTHTRSFIKKSYCVPVWGTHEIIKVPERGGSILVKYTKRPFKSVNFQMFIILSKRLVWFFIFVYITYNFKVRCSIEFAGAVNKKYYSVRQISRIQYILTMIMSNLQRGNSFTEEKHILILVTSTAHIWNKFSLQQFILLSFVKICMSILKFYTIYIKWDCEWFT